MKTNLYSHAVKHLLFWTVARRQGQVIDSPSSLSSLSVGQIAQDNKVVHSSTVEGAESFVAGSCKILLNDPTTWNLPEQNSFVAVNVPLKTIPHNVLPPRIKAPGSKRALAATTGRRVPFFLEQLLRPRRNKSDAFNVKQWCGTRFYSDLIKEGLVYLEKDPSNVVMVYESPSSWSNETSFFNSKLFNYHDYPAASAPAKTFVGPLRYSMMNGGSYSSYLKDDPPEILIQHWNQSIPGFVTPSFTSTITDKSQVFAYLPIEQISPENHINDPYVHYQLAGKDAIHLMTARTTKLLPNMRDVRPCVAKTTQAMGGKGIHIINNDNDEAKFEAFRVQSGHPAYVVTNFVNITRNLACHFFIHPCGDVIWFGSNENLPVVPSKSKSKSTTKHGNSTEYAKFSKDSTIRMAEQDVLRDMQLPFVKDVVRYCRSVGFWGFCGIDVLFDQSGQGYVVDVNPRVTGTCPSLMVAQLLQQQYPNFQYGVLRRTRPNTFPGSAEKLLSEVHAHNKNHEGNSRIVVHSFHEKSLKETNINIAVYGPSLEVCENILNQFAKTPGKTSTKKARVAAKKMSTNAIAA